MSNLVIVESPAKAKTIAKYLNQNPALASHGTFKVVSSMGHIRDLEKKDLGIDVENDFKPRYVMDAKKQKLVRELKNAQKEASMVWLASDYDREGEAIAMHLKHVLGLKRPSQDYFRITFTEITPNALEKAIQTPRDIDHNLVDAQETRRILDRLVGFNLSPVLWKKFSIGSKSLLGLSAGRVQSAVLHMLVEKEGEIACFSGEKNYWHVLGDFNVLGQNITSVHLYQDKTVKKISDGKDAHDFLGQLKGEFFLDDIVKGVSRKNPDPPYITSSLQQDAFNKLGYPMKKAMKLAQDLYEAGHITYMRTDSHHLSDDFKKEAHQWVQNKYGNAYIAHENNPSTKRRAKVNAQEAHEAIRPTRPNVLSSQLPQRLSSDHKNLYDLIWKRAIASQMAPCVSHERNLKIRDITFSGTDLYFACTCSRIAFAGYLIVYGVSKHNDAEFKDFTDSTNHVEWQQITARHTWSSPPARYNESSMVRLLEKEGIGRPSTYSSILTKLFEKQYISKKDIEGKECRAEHFVRKPTSSQKGVLIQKQESTVVIGKESNKVVPTSIGMQIDAFLAEHFDYIVDKTFTAHMEEDLDKIARAEKDKLAILTTFWKRLDHDVQEVVRDLKTTPKVKCEPEKNVILDEENGVKYTIREAKYGPVIAYEEKSKGSNKKEARYIPLKGYLATTKKDLFRDITLDDIRFLQSMPQKVGSFDDGREVWMAYGSYGFYARVVSNMDDAPISVSLPSKVIHSYLDTREIDLNDVSQAIAYKLRPDKPKKTRFTTKKGWNSNKKK